MATNCDENVSVDPTPNQDNRGEDIPPAVVSTDDTQFVGRVVDESYPSDDDGMNVNNVSDYGSSSSLHLQISDDSSSSVDLQPSNESVPLSKEPMEICNPEPISEPTVAEVVAKKPARAKRYSEIQRLSIEMKRPGKSEDVHPQEPIQGTSKSTKKKTARNVITRVKNVITKVKDVKRPVSKLTTG